MLNPFGIVTKALRLWWDQWFILTILNIGWLLAQLLVVTGPPATAVLYAMSRRTLDGDFWDQSDVWHAFRTLFWPAWRWALINGVIVGVAVFNLLSYPDASEGVLRLLRPLWIGVLLLWGSLNLFYWPFWLEQEDTSMRNTYANCGRFLLLNLLPTGVLLLLCILLVVISIAAILPLSLALMTWLALIGVTAVQHALQKVTADSEVT